MMIGFGIVKRARLLPNADAQARRAEDVYFPYPANYSRRLLPNHLGSWLLCNIFWCAFRWKVLRGAWSQVLARDSKQLCCRVISSGWQGTKSSLQPVIKATPHQ